MDYDWAARLGELARRADIALSMHAPLAGFMGHAERGKKLNMAIGMLDHSAGIAGPPAPRRSSSTPASCSAARARRRSTRSCEQLGELRDRLEGKDRAVPFGIEVMGRVRDLGSLDDVVEIAARLAVGAAGDRLRAHARDHRRSAPDGEPFADALAKADAVLAPGVPFHIHFSDIAYANRNETKHLPYGEGTLRAEPLARRWRGFERPATVISESPTRRRRQP
jgi:endonuclease IV